MSVFVQVYHTNHNTTDTAYNGPPSKGARTPTAPGFRVASTPHEKTIVQVAKKGRAGIVNRGGAGFNPLCVRPPGNHPGGAFSIHCGAVPYNGPAKTPGHSAGAVVVSGRTQCNRAPVSGNG